MTKQVKRRSAAPKAGQEPASEVKRAKPKKVRRACMNCDKDTEQRLTALGNCRCLTCGCLSTVGADNDPDDVQPAAATQDAGAERQEGADTAGDLRAAWPFPKSSHQDAPREADEPQADEPAQGAERIHVDQVRLYTDPSLNTIQVVALEQLVESPFNPRTRYEEKALAELAETVRGVGIMQPLLVRPINPDGWALSRGGETVQAYEIVYGHRRYRAAKLAGETTAPVIARELTDAQAAQLQAIENVQREDLDPLEEARGYQHYIQHHGVSKDQLADEMGLSRSTVYSRLKLLTLPEEIQQAVVTEEIAIDVGLAIARLHTPAIQAKALAALRSNHHDLDDGGKRSVRNIKRFLNEKFSLDLDEALFDTNDAALLEGADACTSCPKRTGNAPEYEDVAKELTESEAENMTPPEGDDANANGWVDGYYDGWSLPYQGRGGKNRCTDPDCYDAKKKAHLKIEADKLVAQGKAVIAGNKARSIVGANGEIKAGYIAVKDLKSVLTKKAKGGKNGKSKTGEAAGDQVELPAVTTIIVQDPRDGTTHEVVKLDEVKAAGVKVKEAGPKMYSQAWYAEENRKRNEREAQNNAKAAEVRRVNYAILGAVRLAAAGQPLSGEAVQLVAKVALAGVGHSDQPALCSLYRVGRWEQLLKQVESMPAERLTTLLLDCALVQDVHTLGHTLGRKATTLEWAAAHYGVNVEEIRADLAEAAPADTKTKELLPPGDADQEQEEEGAEA